MDLPESTAQELNKPLNYYPNEDNHKGNGGLNHTGVFSTGSEYHSVFEKEPKSWRNSWVRWLALGLMTFGNFGPYFCFDNPQALQSNLEPTLGISDTEYNLLYTLYSLPNIALALVGGLVNDFLGIRIALILFSSLTIVGQVITTIAASHASFAGLLVGRLFFGIGEESLVVTLNTMISKWFKGKEIAFAFGMNITVTRLGSSLNTFLTPRIYDWTNSLYIPFLVGVFLNIGSWVCCLVLSYIDKKADLREEYTTQTKETHKPSLKDLKLMPLPYWLLLVNCFLLYGSYFGLMDNMNDVMTSRFGFSSSSAGTFIIIVYLSSAVLNPIFGLYFDKVGKRVLWMLVSTIVLLISHLIIAFISDGINGPNYAIIAGLFGVGLFISIFSPVFWPCISFSVDKKVTGTAYGFVGSMVNLSIATVPLAAGAIHDKTVNFHAGYYWSEIFLAGIVVIAIVVTIILYREDKKRGGTLDNVQKREGH